MDSLEVGVSRAKMRLANARLRGCFKKFHINIMISYRKDETHGNVQVVNAYQAQHFVTGMCVVSNATKSHIRILLHIHSPSCEFLSVVHREVECLISLRIFNMF